MAKRAEASETPHTSCSHPTCSKHYVSWCSSVVLIGDTVQQHVDESVALAAGVLLERRSAQASSHFPSDSNFSSPPMEPELSAVQALGFYGDHKYSPIFSWLAKQSLPPSLNPSIKPFIKCASLSLSARSCASKSL